ncbi:MAG: tyrosine--tRNA ligase [Candidatus Omnitrophica bacterium CG11_big_fil_rev_8_21_14_0_20_45_26]|uniref:Tyrosine--tRNA ligase n=1 Tax=Candidatus Abzuiibacterium crystallinum TaxID=1974748 RepID=A0A2H0LS22_9BACT|nr:MAG: tyrosine--tRNA ligase [Candidatus Omnitrophica bacterium CG11_big_fil_rev_8_21_14_0_20_45_26]PIW64057.1 MAG: tyrosine--tRNA ligase [Candidatus Omnitrophica bacterium CG12_big_fil_rev_8_21_14_0_65_45_16]
MNPKDQLEIFKRDTIDLIAEEDLLRKLKKGKPLRIKYGADPSAPDLHLGHTVPLRKLKALQELGHTIIFLIGDFTARIGDPSFRSETRKVLSEAEVKKNSETYQKQVFRILDKAKNVEVVYNSTWLNQLKPSQFLELTGKYTVARILERDDFKKRYEQKQPITILEFLYPLLQGYDSVALQSDVELGGTDQKFNLLVGRELQRDYGQEPQVVMTMPIIEGLDGKQKMSKSLGNHIALQDAPDQMFGKVMSISDQLIVRYLRYLTSVKEGELAQIEQDLKNAAVNPRDVKARLAKTIVSSYYDDVAAQKSSEQFDRVFKKKELPDEIPNRAIPKSKLENGEIAITSLLVEAGLASSKGEARRLVEQGGVKVDQKKIEAANAFISLKQPVIVQCGKRKFARVQSSSER